MGQFLHAESIELLHSGDDYFDKIIALIDEAQEDVHLQTFIFEHDETGRVVGDHLIKAAQRGVKVYLLLDGYGSRELPKDYISVLKASGIQFRFFSPFFSSEDISIVRRIHHKILVVDKFKALIGGINIGNRYKGGIGEVAWLDMAILVKGNCCLEIHHLCQDIFDKKRIAHVPSKSTGEYRIQFSVNDWFKRKNEIYNSYKAGVKDSKESITMLASYFLPGYFFIRRLKNAAKRGVKIRIVVGGVSDIKLFHHAEKFLYPQLIKSGIEIYEWKDSVLHAKAAIFDGQWSTIGSYNLNNLSKYQCIELNVNVYHLGFSRLLEEDVNSNIISKCQKISPEDLKRNKNIFHLIKSAFAYYLYKLIMFLIAPVE